MWYGGREQISLTLNGINFVIDSTEREIPYFEYDENWFDALKNNPSLILNVFDWMAERSPDGFGLVEDYFSVFDGLWESGDGRGEFAIGECCPWENQANIDFHNKWKRYLGNPYISEEQRQHVQNFLNNPRWLPKEPKIIKPPTPGYIYLVECQGLFKIGKEKNKTSRTNHFKTIMPVDINFIYSFYSEDYNKAETLLHKKFSHLRQKGEWFNLSSGDIEYICSISDCQLP